MSAKQHNADKGRASARPDAALHDAVVEWKLYEDDRAQAEDARDEVAHPLTEAAHRILKASHRLTRTGMYPSVRSIDGLEVSFDVSNGRDFGDDFEVKFTVEQLVNADTEAEKACRELRRGEIADAEDEARRAQERLVRVRGF